MKQKICINRQTYLIILIGLLFVSLYLVISSTALSTEKRINSKAQTPTTPPNSPQSISDGGNSNKNYVLYVGLKKGTTTYTCSGVLIKNNRALTAKHCFDGSATIDYISNYDDSSKANFKDPSYYRSSGDLSIVSHSKADLVVIKINTAYSKITTFPTITTDDNDYKKGNQLTVYGWGQLKNGNNTTIQQFGNQKVMYDATNSTVETFLMEPRWLSSTKMTAGDSGGPVMKSGSDTNLIGLQSESATINSNFSKAIRLKTYATWISAQ